MEVNFEGGKREDQHNTWFSFLSWHPYAHQLPVSTFTLCDIVNKKAPHFHLPHRVKTPWAAETSRILFPLPFSSRSPSSPPKKRVCRCGQVKSKDIYWATMLGAWSEYDQSLSLSQPPPPPNIPLCLLFSLSWFHLKEIFFFRVISFKDNWSGWLSPDLF